jgi:hypothetical protein
MGFVYGRFYYSQHRYSWLDDDEGTGGGGHGANWELVACAADAEDWADVACEAVPSWVTASCPETAWVPVACATVPSWVANGCEADTEWELIVCEGGGGGGPGPGPGTGFIYGTYRYSQHRYSWL